MFGSLDKQSSAELMVRYRVSQKEIQLKNILDNACYRLIEDHAHALSVSKEHLFLPLLVSVSGCMSHRTEIIVNEHWKERSSLWCVVGSRRGERKSPALNKVKDALLTIQSRVGKNASANHLEPTCLVLDPVLMSDISLESVLEDDFDTPTAMSDNFGNVIRNVLNQNERYSPISNGIWTDPSALSLLYDGWPDEFRCSDRCSLSGHLHPAVGKCVSFFSFMDASDLVFMLDEYRNEFSCCLDRMLVCCPPPVGIDDVNVPTVTPPGETFQTILSTVRDMHADDRAYRLTRSAQEDFKKLRVYYNRISRTAVVDERVRGTIGKASGLLVRIAAAVTALRNATSRLATTCGYAEDIASTAINSETLYAANSLLVACLTQKLSLMGADVTMPPVPIMTTSETNGHHDKGGDTIISGVPTRGMVVDGQQTLSHILYSETRSASTLPYCSSENVGDLTDDVTPSQPKRIKREPEDGVEFGASFTSDIQVVQRLEAANYQYGQDRRLASACPVPESEEESSNFSSGDVTQTQFIVPTHTLASSSSPLNPTTTIDFNDSSSSESPSVSIGAHGSIETPANCGKWDALRQSLLNRCGLPANGVHVAPSIEDMQYIAPVGSELQDANQFHGRWHVDGVEKNNARFGMLEKPTDQKIPIEDLSDENFICSCAVKIRKLLMFPYSQISCGQACQRRLFPGVPKYLRIGSQATSHPAWAAGIFFHRLANLGLGCVVEAAGNFKACQFRKFPLSDMSPAAKEVLSAIGLTETEYVENHKRDLKRYDHNN